MGTCPPFLFGSPTLETSHLIETLRQLIEPIAADAGLELWDLRLGGSGRHRSVQIFVDRASGGVTLDECAEVSRALAVALDVENPISGPYRLEVSSPGIERVLTRPEHFRRYVGSNIRVQLTEPVDGRRNLRGVLSELTDGEILVEDERGGACPVRLDQIRRASLVVDLAAMTRRSASGRSATKH